MSHWELSGGIYHVALHLADSIPADQLAAWCEKRAELALIRQRERREWTVAEVEEMKRAFQRHMETYLSVGYGACLLRHPQAADVVRETLLHGQGTSYGIHLWCVMPNHLHVIVKPYSDVSITKVVADWKSVSAHRLMKLGLPEARTPVWMRDHYSRIIRTPEEYRRQVDYVWRNPESAGLSEGFARERYDGVE